MITSRELIDGGKKNRFWTTGTGLAPRPRTRRVEAEASRRDIIYYCSIECSSVGFCSFGISGSCHPRSIWRRGNWLTERSQKRTLAVPKIAQPRRLPMSYESRNADTAAGGRGIVVGGLNCIARGRNQRILKLSSDKSSKRREWCRANLIPDALIG